MSGSLRLGLVTYQLAKDWDLETIIANCRETGWEAVELRTEHAHGVEPELDQEGRRRVRSLFDGSGVRLLSFGSICEFHSPDPEEVRRHIERAKAFVDLAADVGAVGVKVRPNGLATAQGVPEAETLKQIGESLRECGEAASQKGVEIWLEVHGKETSEPHRIRTIMEHCGHPAVGVTWNCNPPDIKNGSIKESYDLLEPWVRVFHIQELWNPAYPWMELFETALSRGFQGYALAEIPESAEPIRLMRYYKALFEKMVELASRA